MDPNNETEQKHVVVNSPGQRREVITERSVRVPESNGPSTGTIALIAVVAVLAIGIIAYLVVNKNDNEAANRNANIDVASQSSPQQPPVIVHNRPSRRP